MDFSPINNISFDPLQSTIGIGTSATKEKSIGGSTSMFDAILNSAVDNIKTVNELNEAGKEEKMKLALGETENPHDMTIALEKASTALQYTIAVRDKFMQAYKEIMQMQI